MRERREMNGQISEDIKAQIAEMPYESAKAELEKVVASLERGNLTLEESLALWERGQMLADRCSAHLSAATERIKQAQEKSALDVKPIAEAGSAAQEGSPEVEINP